MNPKNLWRVAVGSGAAALCLGVTAPIVAGGFGSADVAGVQDAAQAGAAGADTARFETVARQDGSRTLAEQQALLERYLNDRIATLDRLERKVIADGRLTEEQKAVFAREAAKVRAALVRLKAAVSGAGSMDELNRILADAARAMPRVVLPRLQPAPADAPVDVPVDVAVNAPAQPDPADLPPAERTAVLVVNTSTDHPRAWRTEPDTERHHRDRDCDRRGDYEGRHRAADSDRRDTWSRSDDGDGWQQRDGHRGYERHRYQGR